MYINTTDHSAYTGLHITAMCLETIKQTLIDVTAIPTPAIKLPVSVPRRRNIYMELVHLPKNPTAMDFTDIYIRLIPIKTFKTSTAL